MLVLDLMVAVDAGKGSMRPLLLILLVLAVLFLLAGAILALVALRSYRRSAPDMAHLEQLENEAG